jgi:hypothetical protein
LRAEHWVVVGCVRSHARLSVTPDAKNAQAFVMALDRASCSVGPSTVRHTPWPRKLMHTEHRWPLMCRLRQTTNAMKRISALATIQPDRARERLLRVIALPRTFPP